MNSCPAIARWFEQIWEIMGKPKSISAQIEELKDLMIAKRLKNIQMNQELQAHMDERFDALEALIGPEPEATKIKIDLGNPVEKP